nr:variable surface lipoprotein [Mycoplasmopsis bovis]
MKKSKFLLLGSVASLASIPFVAAKCGETKEENKPEARPKIQVEIKTLEEKRKKTSDQKQGRDKNKRPKINTWLKIRSKKSRWR